eukprot:356453-Chlamydomonas_euryale.AAC.4
MRARIRTCASERGARVRTHYLGALPPPPPPPPLLAHTHAHAHAHPRVGRPHLSGLRKDRNPTGTRAGRVHVRQRIDLCAQAADGRIDGAGARLVACGKAPGTRQKD